MLRSPVDKWQKLHKLALRANLQTLGRSRFFSQQHSSQAEIHEPWWTCPSGSRTPETPMQIIFRVPSHSRSLFWLFSSTSSLFSLIFAFTPFVLEDFPSAKWTYKVMIASRTANSANTANSAQTANSANTVNIANSANSANVAI